MVKEATCNVESVKMVAIPRSCSNCGYSWTAYLKVNASVKADSSSPKDIEKANKLAIQEIELLSNIKQKDIDEKVLCPMCDHFCMKSMQKHFPHGYRDGILKKYRQAGFKSFFTFLVLLTLSSALVAAVWAGLPKAMDWTTDGSGEVAGYIIFLGISVVMLVISLKNLGKTIHYLICYPGVAKIVHSKSDDVLLSLAVICYKANKESLKAGTSWAELPIKYKKEEKFN